MTKHSTRIFIDKEIRAIWDFNDSKWWYSAVDVVSAITDSSNPRIYWNAIKNRNQELLKSCNQLKLYADDGKKYLSDVIDEVGIIMLGGIIRFKKYKSFRKWIDGNLDHLDEQSKKKAYELYKTSLIDDNEIGKVSSLQKIHAYLFEGLYQFAGKIRTKTISKDGFIFANGDYLPTILKEVESMPENTFDEIIEKYVKMNVAHPFMEGNGRATRIWLDLILIKREQKCIDWSKIDKNDYLDAMRDSPVSDRKIKLLIQNALTDDIDNRELYMKGIDTSYYYEQVD